MPNMDEIISGHWSVKALTASVILMIVGMVGSMLGPGEAAYSTDTPLKCMNPECDYAEVFSLDDFNTLRDQYHQQWVADPANAEMLQYLTSTMTMGMPMMMDGPEGMGNPDDMIRFAWGGSMFTPQGELPMPLPCPKCGQKMVLRAIQCPECGEIFKVSNDPKYTDKCPKCGFSRQEERAKEKQAEKKSKKDKKKN